MKCMQAKDSDLDDICNLLAAEFFDDPIYRFVFTHRIGRIDRLSRFFRIYVELAGKYGGILLLENFAGVQVYFRPEFMAVSRESLDIDNRLRQACGTDYSTVAAWMNGADSYHPRTQPHYYLFLTAVEKAHRGHDGAKAMKTLFTELSVILDNAGFPCYSECTRSGGRGVARPFGFRDIGPARYVAGFPEFYQIWREPQKSVT